MAKKRSQNQSKPASLSSSELVKRRTRAKSTPSTRTTQGDFKSLVVSIVQIHQQTQEFAARAVNLGLTFRNWFIGYRIVEFEQQGRDRAAYGENLMDKLSRSLATHGLPRVTPRELRRYRQVYLVYPRIWESVTPESLAEAGLGKFLPASVFGPESIRESVTPESQNVHSASPQLILRLSFTHLSELIQLPDETQRRFYEVECIRGSWSVRELRRQIASLYYERSGLSKDKAKLSAMAHAAAETMLPAQIIRDPYIFDFLGIRSQDTMGESDLEDALLDRLQEFLLEMGHGFCFEARQKRILIGDEHFFVDLVFYHRVLKCHVLVELKTTAFTHEHLGQLNTYVAYYRKHEMTKGDQPPVGILLCTQKNEALVEFALGDLSNQLFVSRYAVEMPKKQEMERFLQEIGKEVGYV
jgi:predicted nuclease of restriction endonuclease-like (RecB) superfamily